MKNMDNINRPAVTVGSVACYRTKSGSYNHATVKDIVESEYGQMAVLTYMNKDGNVVEFRKLLRNIWVYTGKDEKAKTPAEKSASTANSELTVGKKVFYITKTGKVGSAIVTAIENETATIQYTFFNTNGGKPVTKKLQRNVSELFNTHEKCKTALSTAETAAKIA